MILSFFAVKGLKQQYTGTHVPAFTLQKTRLINEASEHMQDLSKLP